MCSGVPPLRAYARFLYRPTGNIKEGAKVPISLHCIVHIQMHYKVEISSTIAPIAFLCYLSSIKAFGERLRAID